jgi:hypothetical protein
VPGDQQKGFFARINEKEAAQFLSLAANSIQVGQLVWQIVSAEVSESDTDQILNAISELSRKLDQDFEQLGALIDQQIERVLENENAIALADAMAHSATGSTSSIATSGRATPPTSRMPIPSRTSASSSFSRCRRRPTRARRARHSRSSCRASARRVSFASSCSSRRTLRRIPDDVRQVQAIVALAQGMIDAITATVESAHTIELVVSELPAAEAADEHPRQPGHPPQPVYVYEGYYHDENGEHLEFFSAGEARRPDDPRALTAKAEAEAARERGVGAELAYLGIPQFQQLVGTWKASIANPADPLRAGLLGSPPLAEA